MPLPRRRPGFCAAACDCGLSGRVGRGVVADIVDGEQQPAPVCAQSRSEQEQRTRAVASSQNKHRRCCYSWVDLGLAFPKQQRSLVILLIANIIWPIFARCVLLLSARLPCVLSLHRAVRRSSCCSRSERRACSRSVLLHRAACRLSPRHLRLICIFVHK